MGGDELMQGILETQTQLSIFDDANQSKNLSPFESGETDLLGSQQQTVLKFQFPQFDGNSTRHSTYALTQLDGSSKSLMTNDQSPFYAPISSSLRPDDMSGDILPSSTDLTTGADFQKSWESSTVTQQQSQSTSSLTEASNIPLTSAEDASDKAKRTVSDAVVVDTNLTNQSVFESESALPDLVEMAGWEHFAANRAPIQSDSFERLESSSDLQNTADDKLFDNAPDITAPEFLIDSSG